MSLKIRDWKATLCLSVLVMGLCVCSRASAQTETETQCYYSVTGYAGTFHPGPFSSQAQCEQAAQSERAIGYNVPPCTCSSTNTSVYSGAASSPAFNPAFNAVSQGASELGYDLGTAIGNWLFGSGQKNNQTPNDQQRQIQLLQQEAAQQQARQQKWQQDIQQLSAEMKGPVPPEGELQFKDQSTNFFSPSVEGGGGRELQFKTVDVTSADTAISSPMSQLSIANCISKMAAEPGRSPEDASYLSQQAAAAMQGDPVQVDTSGCKTSNTAAAVKQPPTQAQIALYTKLLELNNQAAEQAIQLQKKMQKLQAAKQKDAEQVAAQTQAVQQLQSQSQSTSTADSTADPAAQQQPPSNALAEAEAALQQAQQAQASDNQTLAQTQDQMNQLNEKTKQNQACFNQAQSNPSQAASLMQTCAP